MEWTLIEAMWHDKAQRLQQASPVLRETFETQTDAVGPVERKTTQERGSVEQADTALGATV